jgi:N-methylhydantoinase A
MDRRDAAEGIIKIIDVKMEEAIKAISTMRGHDLRDFMLLPFGGAGPLHACRIARDLGMAGVIVPLHAGVFSAMGLIMSDVTHDHVRSRLSQLGSAPPEAVSSLFAEMEAQALTELKGEGFGPSQILITRALDLRYSGQGYELTVAVSDVDSQPALDAVRQRFDDEHEMMFGHKAAGEAVENISYRVKAVGLVPPVDAKSYTSQGGTAADALLGHRRVRIDGKDIECAVYQRERLDVGVRFEGPAVIEQFDCTTVVMPEQNVSVDQFKNLVVMGVRHAAA